MTLPPLNEHAIALLASTAKAIAAAVAVAVFAQLGVGLWTATAAVVAIVATLGIAPVAADAVRWVRESGSESDAMPQPNAGDLFHCFKQHPVADARDHALAEGAPEPPKPRREMIEDVVSGTFCVMLASKVLAAREGDDGGPTTTDRSE